MVSIKWLQKVPGDHLPLLPVVSALPGGIKISTPTIHNKAKVDRDML